MKYNKACKGLFEEISYVHIIFVNIHKFKFYSITITSELNIDMHHACVLCTVYIIMFSKLSIKSPEIEIPGCVPDVRAVAINSLFIK